MHHQTKRHVHAHPRIHTLHATLTQYILYGLGARPGGATSPALSARFLGLFADEISRTVRCFSGLTRRCAKI